MTFELKPVQSMAQVLLWRTPAPAPVRPSPRVALPYEKGFTRVVCFITGVKLGFSKLRRRANPLGKLEELLTQNSSPRAVKAMLLTRVDARAIQGVLTRLAQEKRADLAFQVLVLLAGDGVLDSSNYTTGISACARATEWQRGCLLFQQMSQYGVQKDVVNFNATMSALEKGSQTLSALELFERIPSSQLLPNLVSFNLAISLYQKADQWPSALSAFHSIPSAKLKPDVISMNTAINACDKGGQWQIALSIFQAMPSAAVRPDARTVQGILTRLVQEQRADLAFQTLVLLAEDDILDSSNYNTGISACARVTDWQLGCLLFQQMSQYSVQRDVISFNATMSALEKGGQTLNALQLFEAIPSSQLSPDLISFNSAISLYQRADQWQCALSVFYDIPSVNLSPDVVTVNSMMVACEKGEQWQIAFSIFEAMPAAEVKPDGVTFTSMMTLLGTLDQWQASLRFFDTMPKSSIEQNAYAFSTVISILGRSEQWHHALRVFSEMPAASVQPNVVTYSAVMSAHEVSGQWTECLRVFEAMLIEEIEPDLVSFSTALNTCARAAQRNQAWDLLEAMPTARVQADDASLHILAEMERSNWQRLQELFQEIDLNVTVQAYGQARHWQQAIYLLEEMPEVKASGLSAAIHVCEDWRLALQLASRFWEHLNAACVNATMASLGRSSQWALALDLYVAMTQRRLQPDKDSFGIIVSTMVQAGDG